MATATVTPELVYAYKSSKRGDSLLLQAADLAASLDLALAVVVPFVIPADGPECCGIRGASWRAMLREVAEEEAQRARALLASAGVDHSVAVADGSSLPEIVGAFSAGGARQLALPGAAAGTGLARSDLRRIRSQSQVPVQELSPT